MLEFMENRHPEILKEIKETKDISDEMDKKIREALEEFRGVFQVPST